MQGTIARIAPSSGARRSLLALTVIAAIAASSLAAVPAAGAAEVPLSPVPVVLSDFESSTPWQFVAAGGASGTFTTDPTVSAGGAASGRLDVNIPAGTVEVVATVPRTNAAEVEFSVLSSNIDTLAVRLFDSTGQVHQQTVVLNPASTGWQTIRLSSLDAGLNHVSWAGAADGVWHGPITRFSFVVGRYGPLDGSTTGTLHIDDLHAIVPALPLNLSGAQTIGTDNQDQLDLVLQNTAPSSVTIAGIDWTVGSASGTGLAGQVIPANSSVTLTVPVTLTSPTPWTARARTAESGSVIVNGELVPTASPPGLDVSASAQTQCTEAGATLTARGVNIDDVPVSLHIATPHGDQSFPSVAPGADAVAAFPIAAGQIAAGYATVTATATVNGEDLEKVVQTPYSVIDCRPPAGLTGGSVLFVGNSFTNGFEDPVYSYNRGSVTDLNSSGAGGVPGIFKKLTDSAGLSFAVSIEAANGQPLSWHLANRSGLIDNAWDAVVLQEQSTLPLPTSHGGDPAAYQTSAGSLRELIRAGNPDAEAYVYQTWASPTGVAWQGYANGVLGLEQMQSDLNVEYSAAWRDTGFTDIVPVGDAFLRAVQDGAADGIPSDGVTPGTFSLWSSQDQRHASIYGSYLSAAVMYAKITQRNPELLSAGPGTAAAELGISATDAATIHRIAHELVPLPASLVLEPVVTARCLAGKVYLYTSVKNVDDVPADVTVATAYGSKTFVGVAPGKSASAAFNSRLVAVDAGSVSVNGTAAGDGSTFASTVSYPTKTCQ